MYAILVPKGPGKRGHIAADTLLPTQMFPRLPARAHKFRVRDTKNVSDFVQKHFVSATNVSQFAQPKKHHGQQCVRNNVSSFTRALILFRNIFCPQQMFPSLLSSRNIMGNNVSAKMCPRLPGSPK